MSFWTGLRTVAGSFPWTERSNHKPWTPDRSYPRVRDVRLMGAMGMPSVDAPTREPRGERGRAAAAVADARAAAKEAGADDSSAFDFDTTTDTAEEGAYR